VARRSAVGGRHAFRALFDRLRAPVPTSRGARRPGHAVCRRAAGTIKNFRNGAVACHLPDISQPQSIAGASRASPLIAFASAVSGNHRFYGSTTTDLSVDTRVVECRSANGVAIPRPARPAALRRTALYNHNGGQLELDTRDPLRRHGGRGSGVDPYNRAQNLKKPRLGKLLRITPLALDRPGRSSATASEPVGALFVPRDQANLWIVRRRPGSLGRRSTTASPRVGVLANYGLSKFARADPLVRPGEAVPAHGDLSPPVLTYTRTSPGCSLTAATSYRGVAVPSSRGRHYSGRLPMHGTIWSFKAGNDVSRRPLSRQRPQSLPRSEKTVTLGSMRLLLDGFAVSASLARSSLLPPCVGRPARDPWHDGRVFGCG